ncbi:MAG: nucleotidyltransferase domain-containing protein [Candidatus Hydrothermarchaeales archaeon]
MKIQDEYRKVIDEFLKRITEKYEDKIEEIILFGSVAKGNATEVSDVDVLLITSEDSFTVQRLISGIVIDILLKTGKYISVKVLTKEEYELQKKIDSGFYKSITQEGVVIG